MAPLAPVITQTVADDFYPCPAGTQVAALSQPPEEVDPGPFTYAIVTDPTASFEVQDTSLVAAVDLNGACFVGVTAESAGGTSPATGVTITVGDDENPWDDTDDGYPDNPQLPPPLPADDKSEAWRMFITAATHAIVRDARDGVDFVVGRADGKSSMLDNLAWNTALLGPRPDAEIEAEAKRLAAEWPEGVDPI